MKTIIKCPICSCTDFNNFISTQDYFLSNENFRVISCVDCGFKMTSPKPSLSKLSSYYESADYISHSNINQGLVNKFYKIVRQYTLKKKVKVIQHYIKEGVLLDIGSGSGEFLHSARKNSFKVYGIEPNQQARESAIENYNLPIYTEEELTNFESNQFDVITLWHVLEHVYNLSERINLISKLLSKDGILIVALPNYQSWDAKFYGQYWAAYDCPRHLYHFDKNSVATLFSNFGFKIIQIKPMYFDSFYVSLLSEKYKHGKSKFINGFKTGLISNFKASAGDGNYSSLIYVLKQIKP